jgi:hypothetical protein
LDEIPKLSRFRFSILSLLLVMTLAAVSVSHWMTWHDLQDRRQQIYELKEQVRIRNDRLGILTVEDPSEIHVISTDIDFQQSSDRILGPREFSWQIHLPDSTQYHVRWAFGDIDDIVQNLVSVRAEGTPLNELGLSMQAELQVKLVSSNDAWELFVTFDDRPLSRKLFSEEVEWIDMERINSYSVAGSFQAGSFTESFPADSPVVLLRQWKSTSGRSTRKGVVVWLQPQPAN